MAIRFSPGCGCCKAEGCGEFQLNWNPSSPLSRGEYSGYATWSAFTEYLQGDLFLFRTLVPDATGAFRLHIWQAPSTLFSGSGWTFAEQERYVQLGAIDILDETDEWQFYGNGWDSLTALEKEQYLQNKQIPNDAGIVSRQNVLADPKSYRVDFGKYPVGVRLFTQATGTNSEEYFYCDIKDAERLPIYLPAYDGRIQNPNGEKKYDFGIRVNSSEETFDIGYTATANGLDLDPPADFMGRIQQPATCWIAGIASNGLNVGSFGSENSTFVVDADGQYFFGGEFVGAQTGDLIAYRGSTDQDRFDPSKWDLIKAVDVEIEDVAIGGQTTGAELITAGANDLTGQRVGLFNLTASDLDVQPVNGSLARSVTKAECPTVFSSSLYCDLAEEQELLEPKVNEDYEVLQTTADAYAFKLRDNQTFYPLGQTKSRFQINSYKIIKAAAYTSTDDTINFFTRQVQYRLRLSLLWEAVNVSIVEARGRQVKIGNLDNALGLGVYVFQSPFAVSIYDTAAERQAAIDGWLNNWEFHVWNFQLSNQQSWVEQIAGVRVYPFVSLVTRESFSCKDGGWSLTGTYDEDTTDPNEPPLINPIVGKSWTVFK